MNLNRLKIALTVDLMNTESSDMIGKVQDTMSNYEAETGAYLGLSNLQNEQFSDSFDRQIMELEYEKVIVEMDFMKNKSTCNQHLSNFSLIQRKAA